jgi:hypothetical protein
MKWPEVTSLLVAALLTPAVAPAQEELVVASLQPPDGVERRYASQIFQTTARLLKPGGLEDLADGEQREVTLAMSGGSSLAQALKKAFESRQPMDRLVLSAIQPGGGEKYLLVELKNVRVTSYSVDSSGDATMIMGFLHMSAGTQDAMKGVPLFGAAGVTGGLALLDPDIEALKAGSGRRMTLAVPAGSPAARVLKEALRDRQPLGDLVLRATEDGAILIVSAGDGPMPNSRGSTEPFFTIEIFGGRVVSVRPHTPGGEVAMEAITIAYEGFGRLD